MVYTRHKLTALVFAALSIVALLISFSRYASTIDTKTAPERKLGPSSDAERDLSGGPIVLEAPEVSRQDPTSDSGPKSIVGKVTSEDGNPIAGAAVLCYALDTESVTSETMTDESGNFSASAAPELVSRVEASSAGYAAASCAAGDSPLHLTLESDVVVSGRVILPDGNPPRTPLTVYAWRSSSPDPSSNELQNARTCTTSAAQATTSEAGRFELRGLRHGARYHVSAGGCGYAERQSPASILPIDIVAMPDTPEILITVEPLYGISIVVTGPLGVPLPSSNYVNAFPGTTIDFPEEAFTTTSGFLPGVRLNDILADPLADHLPDSGRRITYLTTAVDADRVGPFRVRVAAPGFQMVERQLFAERVRGRIEPTIVELSQATAGFGNVVVKFLYDRGPDDSIVKNIQLLHAWGVLYLVPKEASSSSTQHLTLGLWTFGREPLRFSGVPAGEYQVDYRVPFLSRGVNRQPLTIDVSPDRETVLEIPVVDHGTIAIDCVGDPERGPEPDYGGRLVVTVWKSGSSNTVQFWAFARAPYCLFGLGAGTYDIEVSNPSWKSVRESISVEAGSVSRLRAVLLERN